VSPRALAVLTAFRVSCIRLATMAVSPATPLSAIEGIGPAKARALEEIGAYFVFDLLRASVERLHQAVSSLASVTEVRRWRSMAALLHVAVVTPQWAEALVGADVRTVTDLARLTLDELEAVFAEARRNRVVPDTPSAVQMAEMLKHAASLACSGALMATVRDAQGAPIEGASVRIGPRHETTDARGRFRIVGISMLRSPVIEVAHPRFRPLRGRLRTVRSFDTLDVRTIRLTRLPIGTTAAPPPVALTQLNGDTIPAPAGQPMVPVEVGREALQNGDVLRVIHFYADGTDAKLVSKLLSYEDGRFVVRWCRVPRNALPPAAQLRDHVRVKDGAFVAFRWTPHKGDAYRRLLQIKKRFAGRPAPRTPLEREAALGERLAAMKTSGLFRKRVR
jgi:hypothetical protein